MRESYFFKGKDIRAVENPYGEALNLAGKVNSIYNAVIIELILLIIVMTPNITSYVTSISQILSSFDPSDPLMYYSLLFSIIGIYVVILVLLNLILSINYFSDVRANHKIMFRIGSDPNDISSLSYNGRSIKGPPQRGLRKLIGSSSSHSRKIAKTFRYVFIYIIFWIVGVWGYVAVKLYRCGMEITPRDIEWALPGPLEYVNIILPLILVLLINSQLNFIINRYRAIDYALNLQPIKIPKGDSILSRYIEFLSRQKGYESVAQKRASPDDYFDAIYTLGREIVLIKVLKSTPTLEDIKRFRKKAVKKIGLRNLDRAIIVYPEKPNDPLSEEVYRDVIENPIIHKKSICNIQLVEEGLDGTYDFIPTMRF